MSQPALISLLWINDYIAKDQIMARITDNMHDGRPLTPDAEIPPTESSEFPGSCPGAISNERIYAWMPFKKYCYVFITETVKWTDAATDCTRHGEMDAWNNEIYISISYTVSLTQFSVHLCFSLLIWPQDCWKRIGPVRAWGGGSFTCICIYVYIYTSMYYICIMSV